ncbi:MAG TPA: hypothetical protein DHV29_02465 [Bacteroidales bacterium]|nr:MAG: hypothetical protein A2W94_04670 [Bacteroidetes bacterium GWE2_42_42]HCB62104.1 hypothetical protein [Bacteroidales bacterium]HCY22332.1 hypothetical protein [Bacteroidales bacterium]
MNKKTINIIISVVITAAVLMLIYYMVKDRLTKLDLAYSASLLFESARSITLFLLVIFLMPVNLLCEALKWKIVSGSLSKITLAKAYSGILAGITAGLFLPNRVGEFAGKSLSLPVSQFWKGSVLAVFTSLAQLMMTLIFGFTAIIYFGPQLNAYFGINLALLPSAISVTGILLLLFVFFNIQTVAVFFKRWKKLHDIVSVLKTAGSSTKVLILAISSVRYMVFAIQNLLLLTLFEVNVPLVDSFFLIALMYFILSAVPTFILTDFPARSSVMIILFLSWFGISGQVVPYALEAKIILASFLIWFINLIVPALPGLYFFNKLSVLRKKEV